MLHLDKRIYKDYAGWKLENQQILEQFQGNNNIIYERLEPVYTVLNHIYDMICDGKEVDEDFETIFEVGFSYLNSQFGVIKIYFETLFSSNCEDFIGYSQLLLYLIFIFDIKSDLENHGMSSDIESLNDLETEIENSIMERRDDYLYLSNKMNETLAEVFKEAKYEYVSVIDIFVEIAENLGIFLYEEDELVLGTDI